MIPPPALALFGYALAGPFDLFRMGVTYCVGGYDRVGYVVNSACGAPSVVRQHSEWHDHVFVTDGKRCWHCFDEVDDTCENAFLLDYPQFRPVDPFGRECQDHAAADELWAHVVDGRAATPPPPPPATLRPVVDPVASGPHAAGDTISVRAAVRDDAGDVFPVAGGSFRLRAEDGTTTTVRGTRRADGTVVADLVLPASSKLSVEFVPDAPTVGANQVYQDAQGTPLQLVVDACRYRARIEAPPPGTALSSGTPAVVRVSLYDKENAVPATGATSPALRVSVVVAGGEPTSLPVSPGLEAIFTPPPAAAPAEARLSASGEAGGYPVCPAGEVGVYYSDLGIAFDASSLPTRCYVGLRCAGVATILRPGEPGARARVDALLADPAVEVVFSDNGKELYRGPARADDRYALSVTHAATGTHSLVLEVYRGGAALTRMPRHDVAVREPLVLSVVDHIDLGAREAGSAWHANCVNLDMSASQAAAEHRWEMWVDGLDGCTARVVLGRANAAGRPESLSLSERVTVDAFDPDQPYFPICLHPASCAADVSSGGAALHLVPLTPEFAAQARAIPLRWTVTGLPWYRCHGWWLFPTLATGTLVALFLGVVRPARFPAGAAIRVASNEANLRRAQGILLRGCAGGRPRLFRDAQLGVHGSGDVSGSTRGAPVCLRATRDRGVVLEGPGPLDIFDAASRKWRPVEDLHAGHSPSPRAVYRAGGTCFKVDPE
ncbi:MAG: hypothetical protein FJ102_07890 [Deltaproteobacteria bacterium]|nr:hypothetical protein [Deltaproteobacteria bacterium]